MLTKERQEIKDSVKNLKKAIMSHKKKMVHSPSNISIPLSYMNNVKRVRNK